MNIYRAKTQSITIDEAFTYNVFLDGPPAHMFTIYDANHHVLNTFLCKISLWLFGRSELALRIPSLLGGLLYMVTVLRLCRYAFGDGWLCLLSFAVLTMNPAVLDYMSAARGYGIALAFLFWAMLQMLRREGKWLEKAGVGLALSVASNLTFVFPGAALGLVLTLLLAREGKVWAALDRFILPGILLAFSIVIVPLAHADGDSFYFGEKDLGASVKSVLSIAWVHHFGSASSLSETLPELLRWGPIVIPAVLLMAATACCFKNASPLLILTTGSLIGSVLLVLAAHRLFGILFPVRRTGLYWIPLFLLTCLLLMRMLQEKYSLAAAPPAALAMLCLAQFASQLTVRNYSEWQRDASTKRIVSQIRKNHLLRPKADTRVEAVTWQLEPGLNFYRLLYRLTWMRPVERNLSEGPCDYYVALPPDAGRLEKLSVTRIYDDPVTHAILAVPTL